MFMLRRFLAVQHVPSRLTDGCMFWCPACRRERELRESVEAARVCREANESWAPYPAPREGRACPRGAS